MNETKKKSGDGSSSTKASATMRQEMWLRFVQLTESTTCHALPYAVRTPYLIVRYGWLLFFTISCTFCLLSVIRSLSAYFEYGVLIKLGTQNEIIAEFPAVTFCNLNPVNYFRNKKAAETIIQVYLSMLNEESRNKSDILEYACDVSVNRLIHTALMFDDNDLLELKLKDKLITIDDMLLSCYYDQTPCDKNDFRLFYSGSFGNCYTFNSGYDAANNRTRPIKKSIKPGWMNGLQLELFVGDPDNLPCWVTTNGAIISIHNQSVYPLIEEEGYKLVAGKETDLVVNRMFIERMAEPYGSCVSESDFNSTDFQQSEYFIDTLKQLNGTYTQKYCVILCAAKLGTNISDCLSVVGNYTVNELRECLINATNFEPFYAECFTQCPLECWENALNVEPNFADYPTNKYADSMTKRISNFTERFLSNLELIALKQLNKTTINTSSIVNYDRIKRSILAVNVYYESMVYTSIQEVPDITISEALATMGGQISLFLGVSLLSFLELVELIHNLLFIYFKHKQLPRIKSSSSQI